MTLIDSLLWSLVVLLQLLNLIAAQQPTGLPQNSVEASFSLANRANTFPRSQNIPFYLGGLFSITSSGLNTSVDDKGLQRAEALRLAVSLVNADPDLLPSNPLSYYIQDDGNLINMALYKSLGFLVQTNIVGIVGPASSSVTDPVARLFASFRLPLISYASSSAALSDPATFPSFFRTVASDVSQTQAMLALCSQFGWSLVVPFGTSDTYGSYGFNGFVQGASQYGVQTTCASIVDPTTQLTPQLLNCVIKSKATVLMLFMSDVNAASFIYNFMTLLSSDPSTKPLVNTFSFIASDSWTASSTIANGQKAFGSAWSNSWLKGSIGTIQVPGDLSGFSNYLAQLQPNSTSSNYQLFYTYWENLFSCKLPQNPVWTGASFPTCDSTLTLAQRKAAVATSGFCFCTGDENLGSGPNAQQRVTLTPNSKANLVIDAVYTFAHALHDLIYNCDKVSRPGRNICASSTFSYDDLLYAISKVNFMGKSGLVNFGQGPDRGAANFDYFQFDGNAWKNVGQFDAVSGQVSLVPTASLTWGTKDSRIPISRVTPDFVAYNSPVAVVISFLSVVNIVLALFFGVYFFLNAETPVIKRASPLFCIMMLGGLILVFASLLMWPGRQSVFTCNTKIWFGLVGFVTILSNMLVKTWRIYKIFDTTKLRTRAIHNTELMMGSVSIIAIEVLLLAFFTGWDPLRPVIVTSSISAYYQYETCSGGKGTFQLILGVLLLAFNGALVFAGAILAFLTRNVTSAFNESKYIALSMYNLVICLVIIVPIFLTSSDNEGFSNRQFIIGSLAIWFTSTFTMWALFGPKLYQIWFKNAFLGPSETEINIAAGAGVGGAGGLDRSGGLAAAVYGKGGVMVGAAGTRPINNNNNKATLSSSNAAAAAASKVPLKQPPSIKGSSMDDLKKKENDIATGNNNTTGIKVVKVSRDNNNSNSILNQAERFLQGNTNTNYLLPTNNANNAKATITSCASVDSTIAKLVGGAAPTSLTSSSSIGGLRKLSVGAKTQIGSQLMSFSSQVEERRKQQLSSLHPPLDDDEEEEERGADERVEASNTQDNNVQDNNAQDSNA